MYNLKYDHGTATDEETKDDCSIGDSPTTQLSSSIQQPSRVQFTIPDEYDYICDDGVHDEDFSYRRPQRAVTFGAYYDTHNDEMIPELVPIVVPSPSKEANTTSTTTTTTATSSSLSYLSPRRIQQQYRVVQQLISDAPPIVQMIATFTSCILTYAVMGAYPTVHLQVMTMVLVVLCGATFPHLITAVACGVYAGSVRQETISSYPGIVLLSTLTAIVWQIVSQRKLLLGFSGRLGASAFLGMNMTAIITFAFADSTSTEGYTRYGEPNWTNKMDWEEIIVTIVATIFLAATASWFRLGATVPVNPVLVPSTWALCCMLLISLTDYRYSGSIFDGFAVGSYVAMAAESRLPNICRFAMVGFLAGLGIVLFNPFFLGFGGKSGFTAMIGYSTYLAIQTFTRQARKKIQEFKDNNEPVLPK